MGTVIALVVVPPPSPANKAVQGRPTTLPAPSGPGPSFFHGILPLGVSGPFLCTGPLLNGVSVGEGPAKATPSETSSPAWAVRMKTVENFFF